MNDVLARTLSAAAPSEEPTTIPENSSDTRADSLFTSEDIARAREQEKQKLYPQLEKMKEEIAALRKEREDRAAEEARLQEAAAAEARKRAEEEMDVRSLLSSKESEWQKALEEERNEREKALALLERERQYQEITAYRNAQIEASRDSIIPELLDLVTGNTQDEVNESIRGLQERSARILSSASEALQNARRDMAGTRVTVPAAGPLDTDPENRQFTTEDISRMSLSEYQKYRSQLLGDAASGRARGLFG